MQKDEVYLVVYNRVKGHTGQPEKGPWPNLGPVHLISFFADILFTFSLLADVSRCVCACVLQVRYCGAAQVKPSLERRQSQCKSIAVSVFEPVECV
jgi:hypothetical protein